jgi:hypothetical protein
MNLTRRSNTEISLFFPLTFIAVKMYETIVKFSILHTNRDAVNANNVVKIHVLIGFGMRFFFFKR